MYWLIKKLNTGRANTIFTIAIIVMGLTLNVSATEIIRITNGEWPPYLSEKLPHHGFASHVVSEAFFSVSITVEYGFFPWKRSYKYALDGKDAFDNIWHGTVVWVFTEERAKDFLYSEPVVIDIEVLFHLKSSPLNWEIVDDLKGKKIGGTAHTVYPLFEKAEKRGILTIIRGGNYNLLFKNLLHHDLDAVPQVKHVARYFLNTSLTKEERSQITYSPTIIQERCYHLILSKNINDNEQLLKRFNEGLKKIRDNGRYDELYNALEQGEYDN